MSTYAEDLAISGGVWRTARKRHVCQYLHRERITIQPGERYFDSAEPDDIHGFPYTTKLCAACANSEVKA